MIDIAILLFTTIARQVGVMGTVFGAIIVIAVVVGCAVMPLPGMNRGDRRS